MRIVIIGSGVAALRAWEAIKAASPNADVKILTKDAVKPYSKVALPRYVAGDTDLEGLLLPAFLPGDILLGHRASSIDPEAKLVRGESPDGEFCLRFDRLIIATGALPSCAFGTPFWDYADAQRIVEEAMHGQTAAIIGGGFVGIHLASALLSRGLRVTVFERSGSLLPGKVPPKAIPYVNQTLSAAGATVLTGVTVENVKRHTSGFSVAIAQAKADMLFDWCFDCTGAKPDTTLAIDAGLDCTGGILVDAVQRTSNHSIFAAGDCAAVRWLDGSQRSAGLWHASAEQGRVAGLSALGIPAQYPAFVPWNTFHLPSGRGGADPITGVVFGDIFTGNNGTRHIDSGDPYRGKYQYACVEEDTLRGYFSIGDATGTGNLIRWASEGALPRMEPDAIASTPSVFAMCRDFSWSLSLPYSTKVSYRG